MKRSRYVAQAGIIAAVYAAVTLIALRVMGTFAWGPIQFRVSEAVTVVAAITPAAAPGLALGAAVANASLLVETGNAFALLDIVFGSLATLLGALWTWKFRSRIAIALLGPVVFNALVVPAYLPVLLKEVFGVPLEGAWIVVYLTGVATVGLGQAVVVYGLGWPLLGALRRSGVAWPQGQDGA